ncbi:MAG: hypothetical protein AAF317_17135, partial [Pseudomonadota bacterium]
CIRPAPAGAREIARLRPRIPLFGSGPNGIGDAGHDPTVGTAVPAAHATRHPAHIQKQTWHLRQNGQQRPQRDGRLRPMRRALGAAPRFGTRGEPVLPYGSLDRAA